MNEYEKIMSWLSDEESRFIYRQRIAYNETKDFQAIQKILNCYIPELSNFREESNARFLERVKNQKKIILFGAGERGKRIWNLLWQYGIHVDAIVDNHPWPVTWSDYKVLYPSECDFHDAACVVLPRKGYDSICSQLRGLGVSEENIIVYENYKPNKTMLDELYFEETIIHFGPYETFIDAGAFDLDTSRRFIQNCKKRHVEKYKVYAFEPDRNEYADSKRSLTDEPIELYNYGLWSEETTLSFSNIGHGGSKITDGETGTQIQTVALDSFVKEPVTFIKMDIEGAELEALKGAAETIKTNRPKLAVSLYHKDEDLIELPMFIKQLVPEYRLFVRHYANTIYDTVLYAVL